MMEGCAYLTVTCWVELGNPCGYQSLAPLRGIPLYYNDACKAKVCDTTAPVVGLLPEAARLGWLPGSETA